MENVEVYLRIKSSNDSHASNRPSSIIQTVSDDEITVESNAASNTQVKFKFNQIFGDSCKQSEVYNGFSPRIIYDTILGYDCTVFSIDSIGKHQNYTMLGEDDCIQSAINSLTQVPPKGLNMFDDFTYGIIPRLAIYLFENLSFQTEGFAMSFTYLAIVNDELIDLLQHRHLEQKPIKISKKVDNHINVEGLTELDARSPFEILAAIKTGQDRVKNIDYSVEFQTIFTLHTKLKRLQENDKTENPYRFSKLNFVQMVMKDPLKTCNWYNCFSRVIQALVKKEKYIPYRDCKLTQIMQKSLGGNTKTVVIGTIDPELDSTDGTIEKLGFMSRFQQVENKPIINTQLTISKTNVGKKTNSTSNQPKNDAEVSDLGGDILDAIRYDSNYGEPKERPFEKENLKNIYIDQKSFLWVLLRKIGLFGESESQTVSQQAIVEKPKILKKSPKIVEICETDTVNWGNIDADLKKILKSFEEEIQTRSKEITDYYNRNKTVIYSMIDVHKTEQESFLEMASAMLGLIRENPPKLSENYDTNKMELVKGKMRSAVDKMLAKKYSVSPLLHPVNQFINICDKHFDAQVRAYQTFEQMFNKRTDAFNSFLTNIEKKAEGYQEEMYEKIRSGRITVKEAFEAHEGISIKMNILLNQFRAVVDTVYKDHLQLKDELENIEGSFKKQMDEMVEVGTTRTTVEKEQLNCGPDNHILDCKSILRAIYKLAKECKVSDDESNNQQSGTNNNDDTSKMVNGSGERKVSMATKVVGDRLVTVELSVPKKCSTFVSENITSSILNNLNSNNLRDKRGTLVSAEYHYEIEFREKANDKKSNGHDHNGNTPISNKKGKRNINGKKANK